MIWLCCIQSLQFTISLFTIHNFKKADFDISLHFSRMSGKVALIDVRGPDEFATDHIEGSINIPHTEIREKIGSVVPDKSTTIKVWCLGGVRAERAKEVLVEMGYTDVTNLGGIQAARTALSK